jgi:dienelactone hydrolase
MKKIIFVLLLFLSNFLTTLSLAESIHFESTYINGEKQKIWIDIIKNKITPAPSILVLHGCGGVDNHYRKWADTIVSWGYNAIIIDSFSGLVEKVVCKDMSQSSPTIRSSHALSVATWASQQDWSTKKIGTIGFSHGGWTVLYLTTDTIRAFYPNSNIVSSVAYYPYCGSGFSEIQKLATPIQIHIGELDDWTPAKDCEKLGKIKARLKDNLFIYKDAHHDFDRLNTKYTYMSGTGAKTLESHPEARELSMKRTKEFFEKTLK